MKNLELLNVKELGPCEINEIIGGGSNYAWLFGHCLRTCIVNQITPFGLGIVVNTYIDNR